VLSGHSAGGGILALKGMLDKAAKDKRPEYRLFGAFAFEAHELKPKHDIKANWDKFAVRRLEADLARLTKLGKPGSATPDPAVVLRDRVGYLTTEGIRVISMAGDRSSQYRTWVTDLRATICEWFDQHASDVKTATGSNQALLNAWWANYQALLVSGAGHSDIVGGAHHNLYRALSMLPKVGALAPSAAKAPTVSSTISVSRVPDEAHIDRGGRSVRATCPSVPDRLRRGDRSPQRPDLPSLRGVDERCRSPLAPRTGQAATSISSYIGLVRCAEQKTRYHPLQMLAMLRQLYYGKPWSATSTTPLWNKVIPCSPDLGKPDTKLGTTLYDALRASVNVDGADMGHVFTGLEASVCPAAETEPNVGLSVKMSNEDFAT
jgi:hypothetical protein